ncbi:carbohydrate ABC transporter membrane protein 1 (CUT1 family) [Leucobacter komagatae]|uniref:Carbohydrate ABC transporter membrane protein 1 (CUT1 family) n=2 Tax=Leucobacter TaxID=55968 RepID=A0A542Y7N3_9MICO|nr:MULTISPECIES: sugar ABC transporter permease [Leucobacter]RKQ85683.1 multiple sugar transport system permease protein [Mycolicibacterium mucogenicum 261Sha1.1M5]MBL3680774.1 sugar ABC transporter permease [Leucobacter aridicollis]NYD28238.1 multiple sugar transport system permease protein [Leucobacter aridicollis]TQL44055.1 carbohydrate ABC transporter membrane protein 1 (CUT1 family) [Leucobacter komagatae]UTX53076.1 sugar ABC transporter permease [Leucobacter aridicollis]
MTTLQARQRSRRSFAKMEARQALGFASPALVGLALFTIVPVVLSVVMSFFNWPTFGERTFIGIGNYARLFEDPAFMPALRNTLVYTVLYVPASVILSLLLAVALGPRIRGRGALRVLFFIPVVTPMVANVLVWKMLLQPQGLFNGLAQTWFGLELPNFLADKNWAMIMVVVMSVWQGLGYNMLIFSAALEQLPESVMEAARIDGAKGFRLLWSVTIPMISPSIFFATIMTMITSLQVFVQPQMLTGGGPGNATAPLVMWIYNQGFKYQELGLAAAGAWILFALIIIITAVQFRLQKKWVHYEH